MIRIGLIPMFGGLSEDDILNAMIVAQNNFGMPRELLVDDKTLKSLQKIQSRKSRKSSI